MRENCWSFKEAVPFKNSSSRRRLLVQTPALDWEKCSIIKLNVNCWRQLLSRIEISVLQLEYLTLLCSCYIIPNLRFQPSYLCRTRYLFHVKNFDWTVNSLTDSITQTPITRWNKDVKHFDGLKHHLWEKRKEK